MISRYLSGSATFYGIYRVSDCLNCEALLHVSIFCQYIGKLKYLWECWKHICGIKNTFFYWYIKAILRSNLIEEFVSKFLYYSWFLVWSWPFLLWLGFSSTFTSSSHWSSQNRWVSLQHRNVSSNRCEFLQCKPNGLFMLSLEIKALPS